MKRLTPQYSSVPPASQHSHAKPPKEKKPTQRTGSMRGSQELLNPMYQQLSQAAPAEARLKIDETPCRRGAVKTWLWTIVAAQFTVFRLAATRKARELTSLIGDAYYGVINCDRATMYCGSISCNGAKLELWRRQ